MQYNPNGRNAIVFHPAPRAPAVNAGYFDPIQAARKLEETVRTGASATTIEMTTAGLLTWLAMGKALAAWFVPVVPPKSASS